MVYNRGVQGLDRAGGLRLLGGNNNNNNNNNGNDGNNNNNNNQNDNNNKNNNNKNNNNNQANNYNNYMQASFNIELFSGTAIFCAVMTLLMIFRIKCHQKRERKRKRLGLSRKEKRKNKHAVTGTTSDSDVMVLTDDEIKKFILPSKQLASLEEAAKVARCDRESDRIIDICKPFWISAFVSAIADVINTALLGKELGVDALAIYYIVTVPTALSSTIIWAVLDTVTSLGGQSIGVGSFKLTGQYCQISIILYTILFIPHAVFWIYYLKPTLHWFAPDLSQDIIDEGYNYFLVGLVGCYIEAYSTVLHSLLEVSDHYRYGMISSILQEIVGVGGFIAYLRINPWQQKSIVWVEVIDTGFTLLFLFVDVFVAKRMRWFDGFWKGMIRSVAIKNWEAVWLVLKTAAPMSMGNILLTVEWELLAIFSARMGESYVAAWGIAGTIWGILEYATDCVASAGEIRVAKLLGNGNPRLAKLSAYKCLFLGNVFAILMSIAFLLGLPVIPGWFTNDDFLASLIQILLPYCALGNLALTIGSLAWTLVGAQGRYGTATFHGCIGSIAVTIPFAAVSTYYFKLGLEGLAAAVVIGYAVSGTFNTITLFLSDWDYISYRVMIRNGATEPVEEEGGDDDSWGVLGFMKSTTKEESFLDDESSHRGTATDDGYDSSDSSYYGNAEKASSWWSGFELVQSDQDETRKVIIGPGKLGYMVQSTHQGPMIVGKSDDRGGFSLFGNSTSDRARLIKGEFYLGDVIVAVNEKPTARMKGKSLAKLLHRLQNKDVRVLTVVRREGTGLTTVYQPGPYGSAAIASVVENRKGMNYNEFEDDGVAGSGSYFGVFS